MHIKELHIKNFRGFEELRIEFPENLAVIIGLNGSGKSSVLDAIAIMLSYFLERVFGLSETSRKESFYLNEDDINIKARNVKIAIDAFFKRPLNWQINYELSGNIFRGEKKTEELLMLSKQLREKSPISLGLGLDNLPTLVYYQTNRFAEEVLYKKLKEKNRKRYEYEQFYTYENAFSKGLVGFTDFMKWFRLEEDLENETRLREDATYKNRNLEIVRKAIEAFLYELQGVNISNLRIIRTKIESEFKFGMSTEGSLFIDKNGQNLKIEQLSSGEKMLLMIVSDLARRLSIANQSHNINALNGSGVVLIDEVDLHLHPQWQRAVIPALQSTFPNIQFIVTTHSPQVLSNVEKENILILEDSKIVDVTPNSYGRDSNSILYELMGVQARPEQIQQQLDKCFQLIDEEKLEEAKIALKELSRILGENDSEIVRANTLINFLAE